MRTLIVQCPCKDAGGCVVRKPLLVSGALANLARYNICYHVTCTNVAAGMNDSCILQLKKTWADLPTFVATPKALC